MHKLEKVCPLEGCLLQALEMVNSAGGVRWEDAPQYEQYFKSAHNVRVFLDNLDNPVARLLSARNTDDVVKSAKNALRKFHLILDFSRFPNKSTFLLDRVLRWKITDASKHKKRVATSWAHESGAANQPKLTSAIRKLLHLDWDLYQYSSRLLVNHYNRLVSESKASFLENFEVRKRESKKMLKFSTWSSTCKLYSVR
jgi:hypothetical protein